MFRQALLASALCCALLRTGNPAMAQDNRIDTIRPDAPALAPYGKFAIGVKTLNLVHPKQLDIAQGQGRRADPQLRPAADGRGLVPGQAGRRQAGDGEYRVFVRDGKTEVTIRGKAVRDAPARCRQRARIRC